MLNLIINADDLGLTPGCIEGVIQGINQGVVSDTSLMVNTDYTQEAVAKIKENGINRVGLHLNLTFGRPVLPVSEVPSLVDANGRFRRKAAEAVTFMDSAEVQRELTAQVEKFFTLGLGLTHLDSHHHVHTYSPVLAAAIDLAKQLGVPLRQGSDSVRENIRKAGIATTDSIALKFYEQGATLNNLKQIIQSQTNGTLEIMCHPAKPDPLLFEISSYNHWRGNELAALTSQEIKDFLRRNGVCLIGFDALQA